MCRASKPGSRPKQRRTKMTDASLIPTFGSKQILLYIQMGVFRTPTRSERDCYSGAPDDAIIADIADENGGQWQVIFGISVEDGLFLQAFGSNDQSEPIAAGWTAGYGWQVL